ncbi:YhgE/Pip domain-containing protein [Litchfieldia alkalitelluris]|uniref:YhgE/Pip domain-containing protein n=1 Tax=Litchfieldia alkalitelluris TaxID=304268 RepID=UPI001F1D6458|nr:YhgE/Pip domain-containing protein [Litchfieldia alkalitelluris]
MRKKLLLVIMTVALILPSFSSAAEHSSTAKAATSGKIATKDEVVYASLSPTGDTEEIYVVNILDVTQAGTVIDHGTYAKIENLTDLSVLQQVGDTVQIDAPKGDFYYQGNLPNQALPWNISITYKLDGNVVAPEKLAGANGHLEMNIKTSANSAISDIFYKNYLLQISIPLDSEAFENIEAPDATIANAGTDKMLTFTVMPEQDGDFTIEADVSDLEMQGFDISAVPSTMPIQKPDTDEMTEEIQSLTDAIAAVNSGVAELSSGISEFNNGVQELPSGSIAFKNGLSTLSNESAGLVNASKNIDDSLTSISDALNQQTVDINLEDFGQVTDGLDSFADGLYTLADELKKQDADFSAALTSLDGAVAALPANDIQEEEIQELYDSGVAPEVVDQLVATYHAARNVKETYDSIKEAFLTVDQTLDELSRSVEETADQVAGISKQISTAMEQLDVADQITQLQQGMKTLADNYGQFHTGLVGYTNGVAQLSSNYSKLHSGIVSVANGTNELENGAAELSDGTQKLEDETSELPDQLKEEIDSMMDKYDKSDFKAASFVSEENTDVNNVQFVIKTDSILKEEVEEDAGEKEEKKGFWDRLLDLFR